MRAAGQQLVDAVNPRRVADELFDHLDRAADRNNRRR
jgi:hypothetical protein